MNAFVVVGIVILACLLVYGLFVEERRIRARKGKLRQEKPFWMEEEDVVELDLGLDDDD